MTITEQEYALDLRMRLARRAAVRPLTGREVALAVREARDVRRVQEQDAARGDVDDPEDVEQVKGIRIHEDFYPPWP